MGSARQDLSKMEIEIQTPGPGEVIISTIDIPFPISPRIYRNEDYIAGLHAEKRREIREGLKDRVHVTKNINRMIRFG